MTISPKDGSGGPSGPLDCGADTELFVKTANDFIPATLRIDAGGTIYLCSADDSGLFIKRVIEVSEKEPPEIAALLKGKSLAGLYTKGGFNADWVHCLTLGLESCRGALKDAFMLIVDGQNGDTKAQFLAQIRKETGTRGEKTVLLVDDNLMMLELMAAVLQKDAGELKVLTATDGKEGLEILYGGKVDLLVLNLTMPIMNGYQVLKVMGENEQFRKIPVILSTGIRYVYSDYQGVPDPFAGMKVEWDLRPFYSSKDFVQRIRRLLRAA